MSSNKYIKNSVSFTIPFNRNCPDYVQYTKNVRQIELETHTVIQLLQIVRISGNIQNIKKADQRVSHLNDNLALNEHQDGVKNEVHILQSEVHEIKNSYDKKIQELKNALINNKLQIEDISTKGQENVQKKELKIKNVFQSEMHEIKNTFEQKILELTNEITNIKLEMEASNTKVQENLKNEVFYDLKCQINEIKNTLGKISDQKSQTDQINQKLQDLIHAINLNHIETKKMFKTIQKNKSDLQNLKDKEFMNDKDLNTFYKSSEYVDCEKYPGEQSIHTACRLGRLDVVSKLIQNQVSLDLKDNVGWTSLIYASFFGQLNVVEYLIERQAPVNHQDIHGRTAVFLASQEGHKSIVDYLFANNADINIKDKDNCTPLHLACFNGHLDVVKYLIEDGKASINLQNIYDQTAVYLASCQGHKSILQYLCSKNADINIKSKKNGTSLNIARKNKHYEIIEILENHETTT